MEDFLQKLNAYYEDPFNREYALNAWYDLIRIPSVSGTGGPVVACADRICKMLADLDVEVERQDLICSPVIVGRCGHDPSKKTVLIYAHYDVKPPGDRKLWQSEPFEPEERCGAVFGRGSADNKGPLAAHIQALRYYRQAGIELPVNLIYLFEGDEEAGSKGLEEFLLERKDELQADLVFFSDGARDPSGLPIIALGAKGCLSMRIRIQSLSHDVHSRYAPVLPSAAWRLVKLLSQLKDGDQVLVPGFYDGIIPFTEEEKDLITSWPSSEEELNNQYNAVSGHYGKDFYLRLFGAPTFNINQIHTGANGVIPACAEAQLDIRLVPGQEPSYIKEIIRSYIQDTLGYTDAEIEFTAGLLPSKTPLDTPFLPTIIRACQEVYGEYVIYPCRPSSAPDYLWTDIMKLPALQVRWADSDSNNHAPNEHLSLKEYFDGIVLTAYVLHALSEA